MLPAQRLLAVLLAPTLLTSAFLGHPAEVAPEDPALPLPVSLRVQAEPGHGSEEAFMADVQLERLTQILEGAPRRADSPAYDLDAVRTYLLRFYDAVEVVGQADEEDDFEYYYVLIDGVPYRVCKPKDTLRVRSGTGLPLLVHLEQAQGL